MKIYTIGSVKINSRWRKKLFIHNLISLKPISPLLAWRVNIVGKYADFARKKILDFYKDALVTIDDDSSYYEVTKSQIQNCDSDIILFWEEDNWFICPDKNFFLYLLSEFQKSEAEILAIIHLTSAWRIRPLLSIIKDTYLYKEYRVDKDSQQRVWQIYPGAYLTSVPSVCKKSLAMEILEFNKPDLIDAKDAHGYELDRKKGEEFLKKRSFIEMVPTFHIFREVFRFNIEPRAIDIKQALQIIKLRENQNRSHFGFWLKIINMILLPRVTAGRIKRRIKHFFSNFFKKQK